MSIRSWFKRNWPFALASTVRDMNRQLNVAAMMMVEKRKELDRERDRADHAEQQMLVMQINFSELMNDRTPEHIRMFFGGLVRIIETDKPSMFVPVKDIRLEFMEGALRSERSERIDLIKFQIQMALSKDTPPEFAIRQLMERVRGEFERFVMSHWRDHSILLRSIGQKAWR